MTVHYMAISVKYVDISYKAYDIYEDDHNWAFT